MIHDRLFHRSTNRLGDVAEWLRSGLQIRAKTPQKQRAQRETIPPNNRERIVILGNRFSAHARPALKCAPLMSFGAPKGVQRGSLNLRAVRKSDEIERNL